MSNARFVCAVRFGVHSSSDEHWCIVTLIPWCPLAGPRRQTLRLCHCLNYMIVDTCGHAFQLELWHLFNWVVFSNFQIFSKVDFRSFLNFDACVNDRTCRKGCFSEDLQTLGFQLLIGTSLFEYEWGFSFRMECIQWCDAMCTDPYVHDLVEFNLTFDGLAVAISNAILNVSTKTSADFQIQLS